jgi:hypothetical protein
MNWTPNSNSLILILSLAIQSQSHCDWRSIGRSVSQSLCRAPSIAHDQIFITVRQLRSCFFVGRPLWREDGSVFCICCWPLPAQSFSGPKPLVLATIFYCLIWDFLFVASYDSQGLGGGIRPRLSLAILQTAPLQKRGTEHRKHSPAIVVAACYHAVK